MVARFAISCCVADASAIGLPVVWDSAADLPQGEWIRVKGTFDVGAFNGDTVPVLQASSVEQVAQPEHPYLYP
jgi:putative membrane protein